ncbi:MAG TPA: histidine kinase dimerization/phospho-acceptor domain-containing protein [Pyrinomonadaceae bacterium]|nr:histidine kinase dimerization/phospho-acceptor domain-containing protein [Pyrinomonadaceae bacterium]
MKSFESLFDNALIAVLTVGVAFVVTLAISPFFATVVSPLFLIAVMISAWRGGLFSGFLATVLSTAANLFFLLPQDFSFAVQREEISHIVLDLLASILIGTLSASQRRARDEREKILTSEKNARLEAESANRSKDEFLATVSHELRTPLTTIKTLTHYLRHKQTSEEERSEYLADIASECDRQIDLVHNLLDLSRIRAGGVQISVTKTDIGKVLQESLKIERIEAAAHLHNISIEIEENLPFASADASALRRSVCTMVENSIKYTPDGGEIVLSAKTIADNKIAVSIKDNGRGILPQDMPYLFDSFFRGHLIKTNNIYTYSDEQEVKGIGLGLHLANILIEGMNGKISVESKVGKGSIFTIILNIWSEK